MSLHINKQNGIQLNSFPVANYVSSSEEASSDLHLQLKSYASTLNIIINNEANKLGIKLYDLQVEVNVTSQKEKASNELLQLKKWVDEAEVKLRISTKATLESIAFLFKYVRKKCPLYAALGEEIPVQYHVEQERYIAA